MPQQQGDGLRCIEHAQNAEKKTLPQLPRLRTVARFGQRTQQPRRYDRLCFG